MKRLLRTIILAVSAIAISLGAYANDGLKLEKVTQIQFLSYGSFTGTVKEITPFYDANGEAIEGKNFILTEAADENITNFLVTPDTYIADNQKITVGSKITGFYDATLPVILIYPPQYHAKVVIVDPSENQNIKVDRFDEDLLSSDQQLKLNLSDETEIILQDGSPFDGSLTDRTLIVYYTVTTKSIPPQTTPSKIVVLFEKAVSPIIEVPVEPLDVTNFEIVVENKVIESPKPYTKENGVIMVPLRAIAENLGFEVKWNDQLQSVMLNNSITLTIEKDYYTYNRTAPINLGTAPELVNNYTYVPLDFFTKVARMNNAYAFEGQIAIDNNEKMQ